MYKCNECGETFEKPDIICDRHPYGEGYAEEEWSVCPYCKEAGFTEIEEVTCSRCGEVILKDEARLGDCLEWLCDVCYEDLNYE